MARRQPPTPQTPFIVGEVHDIPFRYGRELAPTETIASVDVDCQLVDGVDAAPLDRVATAPQVDDTLVLQRFSADVVGAQYVVLVDATTSAGRVLTGRALVTVIPRVPA